MAEYWYSRWLFERALAAIYLVAFIAAAVQCVNPAAHPLLMMPHSAPVISARRWPTESISSSIWT